MTRRGAYFLANDYVLDLVIAFLNSFRRFNPSLDLCLIPFDRHTEALERLQHKYQFEIFRKNHVLERCDELSVPLHGRVVGQYRKLAMWEGEFDEFVYMDVDTVVLHNLGFVFEFLCEFDFLNSHSNIPGIRKWVWKDSIFQVNALTREQIQYSGQMGFIASHKGSIDFEGLDARVSAAIPLAPHMELMCTDQPFLNYLVVTSGKLYTSLYAITRQQARTDIPLERWGGSSLGKIQDGQILIGPGQSPVLLVHWAGEWQRDSHLTSPLWRYYRDLNETADDAVGVIQKGA